MIIVFGSIVSSLALLTVQLPISFTAYYSLTITAYHRGTDRGGVDEAEAFNAANSTLSYFEASHHSGESGLEYIAVGV